MSGSNRKLKLRLWEENPHCFYCNRKTFLTNIDNLKGHPKDLMATIEHKISRLSPYRWRTKLKGEKRKVLACYRCNQERSKKEILCQSRAEVLRRSRGFSLSPRGNPVFTKPMSSIKDVMKKLKA